MRKSYPFSELQDDLRYSHVHTIRTKIRGVTRRNDDGTYRQHIIIACCASGDAVFLYREPNNPVDPNVIRVRRIVCTDVPDKPRLGEQLGYLWSELAADLAPKMDKQGLVLFAKILDVTGGDNFKDVGVNIQIEGYKLRRVKPQHRCKLEYQTSPFI